MSGSETVGGRAVGGWVNDKMVVVVVGVGGIGKGQRWFEEKSANLKVCIL